MNPASDEPGDRRSPRLLRGLRAALFAMAGVILGLIVAGDVQVPIGPFHRHAPVRPSTDGATVARLAPLGTIRIDTHDAPVAIVAEVDELRLEEAEAIARDPALLEKFEAEKAEHHNVAKACALLEVSRSAFYEWHQHRPSPRQVADDALAERIGAIFEDSRGTYGWPRVHKALRDEGVCASRKRVARIMRQRGLIGRCQRRWTKTTISDPETRAADLLKRVFGPETVELDRVYVSDIT